MANIHIPPESVDAAALALAEADDGIVDYRTLATAAIRAALAAWPGMMHRPDHLHWPEWPHIILPLNTESPDAEA